MVDGHEMVTDDLLEPLYVAWGIIANARDWLLDDEQAHEWVEAAKRWRDEYHDLLAVALNER